MKYSPWLLEDHTVYLEQKKKKYGQYDKENKINLRKTKKSISLSKSFDRLSINKPNSYRMSVSVSSKFQKIAKVKRGVSTDTYNYYAEKNKLSYCPRIHKDKVMKAWENKKGIKWYTLSPESRQRANEEMTEMLKNKEIII